MGHLFTIFSFLWGVFNQEEVFINTGTGYLLELKQYSEKMS